MREYFTRHVIKATRVARFRGVEEGKARDMRRQHASLTFLAIALTLGASNVVGEPSTYAGARSPRVKLLP